MKDLLTVMNFTIKDMVKRKSFVISTIIILILVVIGFNVPNIIKSIKGEDTQDKLVILDKENIFEGSLEILKNVDLDYEINIDTQSNEEQLGYKFDISNDQIGIEQIKEKIESEEIESAIIIEKADENIKVRYVVKNTNMMDGVPESIINTLNTMYSNLQISKLGLTTEQLQTITPNFDFSLEQTEEQKASGNILAMMLLSLVLFYAIYFCAYQVSSSITTEKTSKIMETLVTSTSPRTIVIGKTLGIGIVGLLQMVLIVATAIISAKAFLEPGMIDKVLDMSNITPYLGFVTIIYFLLGYFVYSLLYALTGSTVSKPEDIQSANGPVAILAVVGFYLSYFKIVKIATMIFFSELE